MASFLAGHFDPESLRKSLEAGGLFESIIYFHLGTLAQLLTAKPRLYYWRTTAAQFLPLSPQDFCITGKSAVRPPARFRRQSLPAFGKRRIIALFARELCAS